MWDHHTLLWRAAGSQNLAEIQNQLQPSPTPLPNVITFPANTHKYILCTYRTCNIRIGVYVNMYTYVHADIYLSFPKYVSKCSENRTGIQPRWNADIRASRGLEQGRCKEDVRICFLSAPSLPSSHSDIACRIPSFVMPCVLKAHPWLSAEETAPAFSFSNVVIVRI